MFLCGLHPHSQATLPFSASFSPYFHCAELSFGIFCYETLASLASSVPCLCLSLHSTHVMKGWPTTPRVYTVHRNWVVFLEPKHVWLLRQGQTLCQACDTLVNIGSVECALCFFVDFTYFKLQAVLLALWQYPCVVHIWSYLHSHKRQHHCFMQDTGLFMHSKFLIFQSGCATMVWAGIMTLWTCDKQDIATAYSCWGSWQLPTLLWTLSSSAHVSEGVYVALNRHKQLQ